MKRKVKITLLSIICIYALVLTSVNIRDLKVGFDYDDTLVLSSPSFRTAAESGERPYSEEYWKVVNSSFHLDKKKLVPMTIALVYKALGYDAVIITSRQGYGGEELKKNWKWFAQEFYFERNKSSILEKERFVAYFGDSDSDITEAREAGVRAIRVKRGPESDNKRKYHPGQYQEFVLPFSD